MEYLVLFPVIGEEASETGIAPMWDWDDHDPGGGGGCWPVSCACVGINNYSLGGRPCHVG